MAVTVPLGPAAVNITGVWAGDKNEFTVVLTQDGVPMDLTGVTPTAQARSTQEDTEALDAVCTLVDPLAGSLTVRWPGEAVRTWMGGVAQKKGVWDLQLASATPGEDPVTVAAGQFTANLDVTRTP